MARFRLPHDGFRVRLSLDGRVLLVTRTGGSERAEVALEASGRAFGRLRLRTRSRPFFLAAIECDSPAAIHWGLCRGNPPRDPADFFRYALDWGTNRLAGHRRLQAQRAVARALQSLLREAADGLARGMNPALRREVLPFRADLRVRLVSFLRRDERGWLRQAVRACPGALLFGLALVDRGETMECGLRLVDDLRQGRRLPEALDAAIDGWIAALPAWSHPLSPWHDDDRRAFRAAAEAERGAMAAAQRLLLRRAGPRVGARQLLLPPPLRFVPEDVPAQPAANASWFEVMKVPCVTVPAPPARVPETLARAFSAMSSRHALALARPPRGVDLRAWLTALRDRFAEAGRLPARDTDPLQVAAEIDLLELRRCPPDPRPAPERIPPRPMPAPPPPRDPLREPWTRGSVAVRPLLTPEALRAEGARMHHCVARYQTRIATGWFAVFSVVVEGKPLTISLERGRGDWRVCDYVGQANREPTGREVDAIRPWLLEIGAA